MTQDPKDTIYIDIDDEITSIIDKVQNSPKKIVALVLPKRAGVFQSIVNMKLLKRTADTEKKNVVLITSESALMPLAGAVGLHVAKTPQSKPAIPPAPMAARAAANAPEDENAELDKAASVGSLSGVADDEAIEVDNTEMTAESGGAGGSGAAAGAAAAGKKGKKGKGAASKKKFKIPNFEKFRSKLFLGIAAVLLLVVGYVMAFMVLPKAKVTLKTDTSNLDTNLTIIADTNAQRIDKEGGIIPAINKEFRKTDTEKVAATGEKNLGKKATGSVTLSLSNCSSQQLSISAGTTVSTGNISYVTQESATLQSVEIGGDCRNEDFPNISSRTVDVVAQSPGERYNVDSNKSFTVAGYSAVSATNDDAMSGGTDKIVKIVTQDDVNKAKDAITKRVGDEAPKELKEDIQDEGYMPIEETLKAGTPTVTSSPEVGAEANEVTITSTTVFTMLGVKENDLKTLVEEDAKEKIDPETQVIRDNGLSKANIRVEQVNPSGQTTLALQTIVVAGPELNEDSLKKEIAGKKRGEIQDMLRKRPGVNDVEVAYSPFWVQSTPKSADKITIIIEGKDSGENADNRNP